VRAECGPACGGPDREFFIQLLTGERGQIEWVVAIFRDVTERFQKDMTLRLRLEELEGIAGYRGRSKKKPPATMWLPGVYWSGKTDLKCRDGG
jgi:hypothetical protein